MDRHVRQVHGKTICLDGPPTESSMVFAHPFTMVISGPSGSGKSVWTQKLLQSRLIQPSPQRVIWCYGQWQPLYEDLRRQVPGIEFVKGIPDDLSQPDFFDVRKKNLIVFDDLMTEAKCDQRLADLFTKGSHHLNASVTYLTQNLFPQGKACRDVALNTQYLVLFNNPIDRQQVSTLAKRIYPTNSAHFMRRFEKATTSRPFGYLVVDLKPCTRERDRLRERVLDPSDVSGAKSNQSDDPDPDRKPDARERNGVVTNLSPTSRETENDETQPRPDNKGDKPVPCDVCGILLTSTEALRKHVELCQDIDEDSDDSEISEEDEPVSKWPRLERLGDRDYRVDIEDHFEPMATTVGVLTEPRWNRMYEDCLTLGLPDQTARQNAYRAVFDEDRRAFIKAYAQFLDTTMQLAGSRAHKAILGKIMDEGGSRGSIQRTLEECGHWFDHIVGHGESHRD